MDSKACVVCNIERSIDICYNKCETVNNVIYNEV